MKVLFCKNVFSNAPYVIINAQSFFFLDGISVKAIKISIYVGHILIHTHSSIADVVELSVKSCFMHPNIPHLITSNKL